MQLTNYEKKVQDKYIGRSYDELVEIAEETHMSDLHFIIAQPELLTEFKEFLQDWDMKEYDEKTAVLFLSERDEKVTSVNNLFELGQ